MSAILRVLGLGSAVSGVVPAVFQRSFATAGDAFSRKDVLYSLANTSDPEVAEGIRAFQRQQFEAAAKGDAAATTAAAEPELELAAQVERKYMAAQTVESGMQNLAVPLSWEADGSVAALKCYVAQLQAIGGQAGFASPAAELQTKLGSVSAGAESAKELLNRLKPFTSPAYHAALNDALLALEGDSGAPVTLDGSSPGYKQFADKVKALAQARKLPWQLLLPVQQKLDTADDDTADKLSKEYAAWLQTAALADAQAEVSELKAEVQRLLDSQLDKSAAAVQKEQQSALAAVSRKLEAAKDTAWAAAYKKDIEFTAWFDEAVAKNPVEGPKAVA